MSTPLSRIPGIGPSTEELLKAHGFRSAEDLATASIDRITAVPGFGPVRAQRAQDAAIALLDGAAAPPLAEVAAERPADTAKEKKGKKKKKDKSRDEDDDRKKDRKKAKKDKKKGEGKGKKKKKKK